MNIVPFYFGSYILIWVFFFLGFIFIRSKTPLSVKIERYIWNSRIDKMQYPPFTIIMRLAEKKSLILFVFVILVNSTMVLAELILGLILIGPFFLMLQGFMAGALIVQADRRTRIFSYFVLIFELGAFSLSSGLGLFLSIGKIVNGISIIENLKIQCDAGYAYIPFALLCLNGIFEGMSGFFNIEGVPGIKAVKGKLYK